MSIQWLRLWHDMPNDPKWRTVARLSGQPIALVVAMYMHLLVDASRNVTRGHISVTTEDLASALDVTESQIQAVLDAMKSRVIEDGKLSGWEKRQPKREDAGNEETGAKSAAQRKKEQREREKQATTESTPAQNLGSVTTSHDESHNVTPDKDKEEIRLREEQHTAPPPVDKSCVVDNLKVCVIFEKEGIRGVNIQDPAYLELVDKGATLTLFAQAAVIATDSGNPTFPYVLGVVRKKLAPPESRNPRPPARDPDSEAIAAAAASATNAAIEADRKAHAEHSAKAVPAPPEHRKRWAEMRAQMTTATRKAP